jgi:RNase P/RNase MRP subunit p30
MIFLHGGHRKANEIGVEQKNLDLLCHPLKDGGTFTRDLAQQAAKNNVGIETNYREYIISENKDEHLNREKELINTCHKEGNKIFLFSATIKEEELVHIKKLIEYGNRLYENLIKESMENVHELLTEKYGTLLKKTGFSLERMKERHKIRQ